MNCEEYRFGKNQNMLILITSLEQEPPNHKVVGGVCLHHTCLTSKDGVFIA